ncbi:hydantoinase B/oxoprolinase family protein [Amycolatopsis pithecellobii]|uniref:Hydantoinase B/oxoprolinase family protein n=1 Tax=Amycolatopsis pithecellobii TaxID=664692 RepID=A0A6N7Z014_9PSEU|nr:hydantoinase B/oxoprolinase family protein [Amycolatopsis pithecellobii]MTD54573.1 hydantoinase B/oxoprolinase family protein [Amycolatopsis pithecellobii]
MDINNTAPVAVRDLDEPAFAGRYQADRFTISVIANRMRYVMQHVCTGLLRESFSPIMREWFDFGAALNGPPELNYALSAFGDSLIIFAGAMEPAVRNTVEEYRPRHLRPGDLLICNDPYRCGTHVNDIAFIRPIYHGERLMGFATIRAHQLDIGGTVPAGFSAGKRNVYENGLVIPPMLLYRDDEPIASVFTLIFDNSRFPQVLLPDIKSIFQSLRLAERLLGETIDRYGEDAFFGAMRYNTDVSADAMREAIRTKIPDGVYEGEEIIDADAVDDSLEYRIKITISKYGDAVEVDLGGTSGQARSSINCSAFDTMTAVSVALKLLIEPHVPFSSGYARNIDVVVPPGTILSATPPDGAIMMYFECSHLVVAAVCKALNKVLGADAIGGAHGSGMVHVATGRRADGTPWVSAAECGGEKGPWGASKAGDGDSYTVERLINAMDVPVESTEQGSPVLMMRREYVTDSGGPGLYRGGASVRRDTCWLTPADHVSTPLHSKATAGFGANDGGAGAVAATWIFPREVFDVEAEADLLPTDPGIYRESIPVSGMLHPDTKVPDPGGEYFYFGRVPLWHTAPGAHFRYQTGGGGGWGHPWKRDPERVRADVRDEYVSISGALRDYGVVITGDPALDPEGLRIDVEATRRAREQMCDQAGQEGKE